VADPREGATYRRADANRVNKADERGEAQASLAQLPGGHVVSKVSALSGTEFSSRLAAILNQQLELESAPRIAGHHSGAAVRDGEYRPDVISSVEQSGHPELLRHEAQDSPVTQGDERGAEQRSTPVDVVNRIEESTKRDATPSPLDMEELRRGVEHLR
jgi:hypothetical protein